MQGITKAHDVVVNIAVYAHQLFAGRFKIIHGFVAAHIARMHHDIGLLGKFQDAFVHVAVRVGQEQDFRLFCGHQVVPLGRSMNSKVMRTVLKLAFDGTPFCGWQVQPEDRTVQGDLNDALSKLLGQEINTVGAGRTDTGVHATEMYAHFDWEPALAAAGMDHAHLVHRLNRFLDPAIRIHEAKEVSEDWHARFLATSRSYEYKLVEGGNPFLRDWAWNMNEKLDFEAMNACAAVLLEEEDFASFCKNGSDNKTTFCDVREARWESRGDHWVFHITADRFLRNMVRAIVGSLVEVGRGKWTQEEFLARLQAKNRGAMGTSAPAHGLYLSQVLYPHF